VAIEYVAILELKIASLKSVCIYLNPTFNEYCQTILSH
jgi:hypothetical protein